jgi:hypothetical protein
LLDDRWAPTIHLYVAIASSDQMRRLSRPIMCGTRRRQETLVLACPRRRSLDRGAGSTRPARRRRFLPRTARRRRDSRAARARTTRPRLACSRSPSCGAPPRPSAARPATAPERRPRPKKKKKPPRRPPPFPPLPRRTPRVKWLKGGRGEDDRRPVRAGTDRSAAFCRAMRPTSRRPPRTSSGPAARPTAAGLRFPIRDRSLGELWRPAATSARPRGFGSASKDD